MYVLWQLKMWLIMKKTILIILIILLSSCGNSNKIKRSSYQENRNLMIMEQIYLPRNKKYFEQNLKKKYRKHKRMVRKRNR
jgi:hypothetical protein